MSEQERPTPEEAAAAGGDAFIVERMRAGDDEEAIVRALVERGVDEKEAWLRVSAVYPQVMRAAEAELFEPRTMIPAIAGGLVAALAAGIGWALIVIVTEYEIGFAAIGVGLLAGYGVVLATGGRKGRPLQVIAAVSSLLGVVVGKYVTYVYFLKEGVREIDEEAADAISYVDPETIRFFFEDADQVFGGFDLAWAAFAVFAAWRVPQGLGIRVRRGPVSGV